MIDEITLQVVAAIPAFLEEVEYFYPNCIDGSPERGCAHRLAAGSQAPGAEGPSFALAAEFEGMGVQVAGDRPDEALFRSRFGNRCRPATDAR